MSGSLKKMSLLRLLFSKKILKKLSVIIVQCYPNTFYTDSVMARSLVILDDSMRTYKAIWTRSSSRISGGTSRILPKINPCS